VRLSCENSNNWVTPKGLTPIKPNDLQMIHFKIADFNSGFQHAFRCSHEYHVRQTNRRHKSKNLKTRRHKTKKDLASKTRMGHALSSPKQPFCQPLFE